MTLIVNCLTFNFKCRDLLVCETLEFEIDMFFPQYWNSHQAATAILFLFFTI